MLGAGEMPRRRYFSAVIGWWRDEPGIAWSRLVPSVELSCLAARSSSRPNPVPWFLSKSVSRPAFSVYLHGADLVPTSSRRLHPQ
jgi:hypothetical protein